MESEESTFTLFNLYFITFPRQLFVNIFDNKSVTKQVGNILRIECLRFRIYSRTLINMPTMIKPFPFFVVKKAYESICVIFVVFVSDGGTFSTRTC